MSQTSKYYKLNFKWDVIYNACYQFTLLGKLSIIIDTYTISNACSDGGLERRRSPSEKLRRLNSIKNIDWSHSLKGAFFGLGIIGWGLFNVILFTLAVLEPESKGELDDPVHVRAELNIKIINTVINTIAVVACIFCFFHIQR